MPRRALRPGGKGSVTVPAHLLLQGEHEGTAAEHRLRRFGLWKLKASGALSSRVQNLAKRLAARGTTRRQILDEIVAFGDWADANGVPLTEREQQQVNYMRDARLRAPDQARSVLRRWLARGKSRRPR